MALEEDGPRHTGGGYEIAMWRGGVDEKLKAVGEDAKETRDAVRDLAKDLKQLEIAVQAQVTKLVIITGFIVWLAGVGSTILIKVFLK